MRSTGRSMCVVSLLCVIALAANAPAARSAPAAGRAAPAKAAAPARPAANRLSSPLPDSVLARIFVGPGDANALDVTLTRFHAELAKVTSRPDTLTPAQARRFLDLVIEKRLLNDRVAHEPHDWTPRDSSDYLYIKDQLMLRQAMDSAVVAKAFELGGRGETVPDRAQLAVRVRDSTVAGLLPVYDPATLKLAYTVFDTLPRPEPTMSALEQMRLLGVVPRIPPADSVRVLVTYTGGQVLLGEFVHGIGTLSPLHRPKFESTDDIKLATSNAIFEKVLRAAAWRMGYDQRPAVVAQLADKAEYFAVKSYVDRKVYSKIPRDSVTLERYYRSKLSAWDIGRSAGIVRVVSETRSAADSMAARLRKPFEAESLAAKSARAGIPYTTRVSADADSLLMKRLVRAGLGGIVGPDSLPHEGWRTIKVMSFEPSRHRTYAEAKDLVWFDFYGVEGERRMQAVLEDLKRHAVIVVNERMFRSGPARRTGGAARKGIAH